MWTWYLSESSLERAFPVVLDSMTTTLPSGILVVKEERPRLVVGNSKTSFFVWPSKVHAVQFLLCASTPTVIVVVVVVVVTHSSPPVHASGTDNLPYVLCAHVGRSLAMRQGQPRFLSYIAYMKEEGCPEA